MRIISGRYKGRIIHPPKNLRARPTTDFAKENLFNIIHHSFDIPDLTVLDLFSGTGSISFEFASRGALSVTSVELDSRHHDFIAKTAKELGLTQIHAINRNVFTFLKTCRQKFDVIFADPPYELEGIDALPDMVFGYDLLKDGHSWFIFEHSKAKDFSSHPRFHEKRSYGSVNFSIFKK